MRPAAPAASPAATDVAQCACRSRTKPIRSYVDPADGPRSVSVGGEAMLECPVPEVTTHFAIDTQADRIKITSSAILDLPPAAKLASAGKLPPLVFECDLEVNALSVVEVDRHGDPVGKPTAVELKPEGIHGFVSDGPFRSANLDDGQNRVRVLDPEALGMQRGQRYRMTMEARIPAYLLHKEDDQGAGRTNLLLRATDITNAKNSVRNRHYQRNGGMLIGLKPLSGGLTKPTLVYDLDPKAVPHRVLSNLRQPDDPQAAARFAPPQTPGITRHVVSGDPRRMQYIQADLVPDDEWQTVSRVLTGSGPDGRPAQVEVEVYHTESESEIEGVIAKIQQGVDIAAPLGQLDRVDRIQITYDRLGYTGGQELPMDRRADGVVELAMVTDADAALHEFNHNVSKFDGALENKTNQSDMGEALTAFQDEVWNDTGADFDPNLPSSQRKPQTGTSCGFGDDTFAITLPAVKALSQLSREFGTYLGEPRGDTSPMVSALIDFAERRWSDYLDGTGDRRYDDGELVRVIRSVFRDADSEGRGKVESILDAIGVLERCTTTQASAF